MPDQPTRQEILSVLQDRGGIHKSALCTELGIGWGNVGHHLGILERLGAVELERHGTRLWAFQPSIATEDRRIIMALSDDARLKVLEQLGAGQAATIRELTESLEYSHKVVRTHLSHLMAAGVIERRGRRPHEYRAHAWLRGWFRRR